MASQAVLVSLFGLVCTSSSDAPQGAVGACEQASCSGWGSALLQQTSRKVHTERKVAVAALVTQQSTPEWLDAFSVFAYSAKKAFQKSKYQLDLLALAEEGVEADDKSALSSFGFDVREFPLPVRKEDVVGSLAREEIAKGCCGESEMLKLYGLTFTGYHRVVVVDGDVMFLAQIDDILDDEEHSLAATYDHGLDVPTSAIPPINGGFLVFTPNKADFDSLIATAKEGDFRSGSGWKGLGVGWAYGGVGPQGLLAYHYNKEALEMGSSMQKAPDLAGSFTVGPTGSRVKVLDRSKYNVIVTDDLRVALNSNKISANDVRVFHFTGGCEKPWKCPVPQGGLCKAMTQTWWQLRREFAKAHDLIVPELCNE